jgi:RND superfamily putative drug exporter
MHLLGPANWALPGWLDRLLPRLAVEAEDHVAVTDPEGALS